MSWYDGFSKLVDLLASVIVGFTGGYVVFYESSLPQFEFQGLVLLVLAGLIAHLSNITIEIKGGE